MPKLKSLVLAACAVALAAVAPLAGAQSWPTRPVKLLVGFPPGGSTDLAARVLASKLTQSLGQSFVVENRAGASGNIAAEQVARAAPDGYTLLMAATSFAAAPAFFDKLSWDPTRDFTPVALVATVPIMVVTTPALPVKNVRELVAYSKANAGKVNMASPGATTLTRLSGEQFKQTAKLDWTTVHYKGGAPAMQDMLAGTSHVMFANISDVLQQVRAGKLNAMAVTTAQRSSLVPDIPTLAESGYPGFSYATWQAVVGPAGVPREVVDKLNAEVRKIMAMADVKAQFATFGTDVSTSSPEELGALLVDEVAKIKRVAASVGATSN
ncbi:tripartite tricarboxylate transporter substrate binding protein [Ramlibacter sp. RBP-2]|uniref:Tripartite tricarboxylate transporter substrate binding protein n=1 Tax=Ramlibacter lithotrophicus TaxID=2606681 RepID=A0A7X6DF71_9BURK|nr:tripartite tricarboxylate transporter substrate binding protein [Ramlibacter lithotrophicus]NKE66013.1 tripartite tricarboxylate transporter substrate binding protein [Ramlibacter lithotrophicus]